MSKTRFPKDIKDGIELSGDEVSVTLVPHDARNAEPERIDEETIFYKYDDKTTIEYSLTYTGFKEDIVVSEYTGQTEYDFTIYTEGLALAEIDGSYYLVDENEEIKATIGDIIIFTADEKNNAFGELEAETVVENEEYRMTIVLDPEYLADPDTVYPIRIDPTVEITYDNNGSGAIEDVTINSKGGSSGTSKSLSVGLRETYGISRILMKFPGLDFSSLGTYVEITEAAVELRDLMCEGTNLKVECYVFAGNEWTESTATWSSVSPNKISTSLSSVTMSYAIGKALSTKHRYSFNITEAVKGWMTGNYNQNKGIIFKATSTLENGSTYDCRTIASYNRASNKPSLSVTYNSGNSAYQPIANATYYINNKYSGNYLKYVSSTSVTGQSGLLSSLGQYAQWEIVSVDDGYVIRSKYDSTKYLAVPDSTSSSAVIVRNISDEEIPKACIWTITMAYGENGYTIKNNYNLKYLSTFGNGLFMDSVLGTSGTAIYNSKVWRTANILYYGNTDSYNMRELSGNFSIDDMTLSVGEEGTLSINKYFPNTIWSTISDFTYTGYSTALVSINSSSGVVKAKKSGTAQITATHKVTGRKTTFDIDILSLLIYQTGRTYYNEADGSFADDMLYADMTESELCKLSWISESDFADCTVDDYQEYWENMCTDMFSTGDLEEVVLDMIDHFMNGSGAEYSNELLTNAVIEHSSTIEYTEAIEEHFNTLMTTYSGDVVQLEYVSENRDNNPLVQSLKAAEVWQPVYNLTSDKMNGLTICIDSLWGNKIEVSAFTVSENSYTCTLHYTLYDHFGLNQPDIEKYGYLLGFRSWYILQHNSEYNGAYQPFLTLIEFDITFSGTF